MNKIISIILLCCLLLTCLSSCAYVDKLFGNEDKEPEEKLPANPEEPKEEDKTPIELSADDERVTALLNHLSCEFEGLMDVCGPTMANMIDAIKADNARAMLVNFQSSESCFVCGYYDDEDVRPICKYVDGFTWVKFENANEITERYKDLTLVVAYQFTKATVVSDIVNKNAEAPRIEHFQIYSPVFEEGINTNDEIIEDDMFVYVSFSKKDSLFVNDFRFTRLSFVHIQGKYYITIPHYVIKEDGTRIDKRLDIHFGKYYDALFDIMITDKYSVTAELGRVAFLGLIEFEDFAKLINMQDTGSINHIQAQSGLSGGLIPPYAMSAIIPKVIDASGDVVPVTVSYGPFADLSNSMNTEVYPRAEVLLQVSNSEKEVIVIKTINFEEIITPEYLAEPIWDSYHMWTIGYDYNHTEIIDIPISMFVGNSGNISINIHEILYTNSGEAKLGNGTGVTFSYTRSGTTIYIVQEV